MLVGKDRERVSGHRAAVWEAGSGGVHSLGTLQREWATQQRGEDIQDT